MTIYMACTLTLTTMGAITSMFQYTKPFNEEERLKLSTKTCGPISSLHSKGLQGFPLCIRKHTKACTAQKMLG